MNPGIKDEINTILKDHCLLADLVSLITNQPFGRFLKLIDKEQAFRIWVESSLREVCSESVIQTGEKFVCEPERQAIKLSIKPTPRQIMLLHKTGLLGRVRTVYKLTASINQICLSSKNVVTLTDSAENEKALVNLRDIESKVGSLCFEPSTQSFLTLENARSIQVRLEASMFPAGLLYVGDNEEEMNIHVSDAGGREKIYRLSKEKPLCVSVRIPGSYRIKVPAKCFLAIIGSEINTVFS
jgi:hypothetical protein